MLPTVQPSPLVQVLTLTLTNELAKKLDLGSGNDLFTTSEPSYDYGLETIIAGAGTDTVQFSAAQDVSDISMALSLESRLPT